MKIKSTLARAGLCSGIALILAGCMSTTPAYNARFGQAVRTVRVMQTLNPDASKNSDPVAGVDGRAATAAMDRYNAQYSAPRGDPNAFTVGVGSSTTLDTMGR
ncbi:hypothetical protein [Ralstonia solanacearum]|uniref:hypothetical protein n=1 Tax=Ralstonia solanacearum TaxID=305 RepID=UPI0018D02A58|nr:hypothetical protein [Ralstonia solanacearum]